MTWIKQLVKTLAIASLFLSLSRGGMIFPPESSAQGETDWEKTVKAAEQEGQVVVYKLGPDWEWNAFQKRFPKIKIVNGSRRRGGDPPTPDGGAEGGKVPRRCRETGRRHLHDAL